MEIGQNAMKSILESPESTELEILNVSEITWEDGSKSEDITTSSTNGIFQDRTERDMFHRTGLGKDEVDAVAFLDPSTSVSIEDEIKRSTRDISFEVKNIEERSGYKKIELREIV